MGGDTDRDRRVETQPAGSLARRVERYGDHRRDAVREQPGIDRHTLPGMLPADAYHSYFTVNCWERNEKPLSSADSTDWLATDEWLGYDIDVLGADRYEVTARVAAADSFGGGAFRIAVDNDLVEHVRFDPTGGWDTWDEVTMQIELPDGLHRLQVIVVEGGWRLDRLTVE